MTGTALRALAIAYNVWVLLAFAHKKLSAIVDGDWWLSSVQDQLDGWYFNGSEMSG